MRDIALKLRLARDRKGLSQKDVGRLTEVGEKTLSSFESGKRINSMKFSQLVTLVTLYGMTLIEFLQWDPSEARIEAVDTVVVAPAETPVRETPADAPPAHPVRRKVVDPLERVRVPDTSPYPSPTSSLGGAI